MVDYREVKTHTDVGGLVASNKSKTGGNSSSQNELTYNENQIRSINSGRDVTPSVEYKENTPAEHKSVAAENIPYEDKKVIEERYESVAEEVREAKAAEEALRSELSSYLLNIWGTNKNYFISYVQPILDECSRLSVGEYPAEVLALIRKSGGSDINLPLASQIASTAESWLVDIISTGTNTRPWGLEATPIPELPKSLEERINEKIVAEGKEAESQGIVPSKEEIIERANKLYKAAYDEIDRVAKEAVKLQETKINDVLEEARFPSELKKLINYITIFPTGFFVGPIYRREPKNTWVNGKLEQIETYKEKYKAVSPYDIFPAPDSSNLTDGDLIWRTKLTRKQLSELKGADGVNDEAISEVLSNFNGYRSWTTITENVRLNTELKEQQGMSHSSYVEVLNFFATIPFDVLKRSIKHDIGDCDLDVVEIEASIVGSKVIKCNVVDTKIPYYRRPVYATSYRKVPDSIYGNSPLMLSKQIDSICNSCVRSLVNNLSIASGPQCAVDVNSIPTNETVTEMYPWKIWFLQNQVTGSNQLPIHFFQPKSNAQELLGVFNTFSERAYLVTGIPVSMMGANQKAGAAGTAKGLAALLESSSKGIRLALSNLSEDVIAPIVYAQFTSNLVKGAAKGTLIYGDVNVVPKGVSKILIESAKDEKSIELIRMLSQNKDIHDILGKQGVAKLLRQFYSDVGFDNDILPSDEILKLKDEQEQQAKQKQVTPEQVEMEKLKVEREKIQADLEKSKQRQATADARLQFEKERQTRNEQIKREEMQNELKIAEIRHQTAIDQTVVGSLGKEKIAKQEMEFKVSSPDKKGI